MLFSQNFSTNGDQHIYLYGNHGRPVKVHPLKLQVSTCGKQSLRGNAGIKKIDG
jgi:hypothetical protein